MIKRFLALTLCIIGLLFCTIPSNAGHLNDPSSLILKEAPHLNPKVLQTALTAYRNAIKGKVVHSEILTIIDYSLPSSQKRLWIIDLKSNHVLFNTWVAHGKESGKLYATHFSDSFESNASSLGVYLTGHTYYGKHGYSLRLLGLEKGFNDTVSARAVVMHQAWYVNQEFLNKYGRLGRSCGCPALASTVYRPIINTIRNGTLMVAYADNQKWLTSSQYLKTNSV